MKRRKKNKMGNIRLFPGTKAEEVGEYKAYTRKRRSPAKRMLVRLAIVSAVLLLFFTVWQNWEQIAPEAVLDWADTRFGEGGKGDGYPYAISGNTVAGMGQVGSYLAVLTDSSLQFLNNNAVCVEQRPNTLSDPFLTTAGRYALVTEIGGSRFRIETRRDTVLEMQLENRKIYAADMTASGTVAVVTDSSSQNYVCGIQVYNRKGKLTYEYKSGKYLITALSLSPNGRSLAAIGTTAEAGTLKSVLLLFDMKSDTPVEHSGTDLMLYGVSHFGDTVLAASSQEYWLLTGNGKTLDKIRHEGNELVGYADSDEQAALVLHQSGSTGNGVVWIFDKQGNKVQTTPFADNFRSVACYDETCVLLTDSTVFLLNDKQETQINTPTDALSAASYRDTVMILTLNDLQQSKNIGR